ncbi:MAG: hypothetical protein VKP72_02525 [bacterium]|nr:hypothetical protein [bacterium]
MAVTRKSDIRRFWLTAGVLLVAGCTAPAVVGHWVEGAPSRVRVERSGSLVALSTSGTVPGLSTRVEVDGSLPGDLVGGRLAHRKTFVALGRGSAGSRIPDAETPTR